MKKKLLTFSLCLICCFMTACGQKNIYTNQSSEENANGSEIASEIKPENSEPEYPELTIDIRSIDYSEYFSDVNGCVVIYDARENYYSVYNDTMANTQVSPYSTFKIVAILMGLKNEVVQDENSTMEYNGTQYSVDAWNKNLGLKEAVQTSCVWYFRQLIDLVGKEVVQKELQALAYGNCDVSEWEGSNINPQKELNGFWLDSSLKISPMEQVDVMKQIFQNSDIYSVEQVNTLKNLLLFDEVNGYSIYGKKGTNQGKEGWYVGMAQKGEQEYYFAVYLNGSDSKQAVSGNTARTIIQNIFEGKQ